MNDGYSLVLLPLRSNTGLLCLVQTVRETDGTSGSG